MEALKITRFTLHHSIRWIPRILGMLYAVFICLFSFDVFDQQAGFLTILGAFLIHNIPTLILIAILVLAWKWSWVGGISYIALGIIYILLFLNDEIHPVIYLPVFITGILFSLDWFLGKKTERVQEA